MFPQCSSFVTGTAFLSHGEKYCIIKRKAWARMCEVDGPKYPVAPVLRIVQSCYFFTFQRYSELCGALRDVAGQTPALTQSLLFLHRHASCIFSQSFSLARMSLAASLKRSSNLQRLLFSSISGKSKKLARTFFLSTMWISWGTQRNKEWFSWVLIKNLKIYWQVFK